MDNPWATAWDIACQADTWPTSAARAEQDTTAQDQPPHSASVSDIQPPRDSLDIVPESTDAILCKVTSAADEDLEPALDDDWGTTWGTTPSSEPGPQPPDQWEAARQEKEMLNRAVVRHLYKRTLQLIP